MSKLDTDIFIINSDGILEINKKEARNTPAYKTIIVRDKGSEGDHDGRKKVFAFKELMFIYTYYHPLSMYRELPDELRFDTCKGYAELPEDWKIDEAIKLAGDQMIADADLIAMYFTYNSTNKAIRSLGEDINFFNERREKIRRKLKEKSDQLDETIEEEERQKLEAEVDWLTKSLMDIATKVTTINDSLPKAYTTVETLKQKILDEEEAEGKIYGGGSIGNRED